MRLFRHIVRLAMIALLLGGPAALVLAASPAASAASAPDGWVRIAHLSPKAPAMDMYMYPFGDPAHPTILRDVAYGDVSAYMKLPPGQYTLAMRGFGAPASSAPALITTFKVSAGTAYTAAALGPDPGLRVEVLKDVMATPTPTGRALVRVLQASLKEPRVSVRYGQDILARQLPFGSATAYAAVPPGAQTVQVTAPGEHGTESVRLPADTASTIVVLDYPHGLKVTDLIDAAGSQIMPAGGVNTGMGGTALIPPASGAPWLALIAAGTLLALAGCVGLRRKAAAGAL